MSSSSLRGSVARSANLRNDSNRNDNFVASQCVSAWSSSGINGPYDICSTRRWGPGSDAIADVNVHTRPRRIVTAAATKKLVTGTRKARTAEGDVTLARCDCPWCGFPSAAVSPGTVNRTLLVTTDGRRFRRGVARGDAETQEGSEQGEGGERQGRGRGKGRAGGDSGGWGDSGDNGPEKEEVGLSGEGEGQRGGGAFEEGDSAASPAVELAVRILKCYKREISPWIPASCRFVPTCSEYSVMALRKYGIVKGGILTAWRLLRCNPLGPSGYDPPRWFGEPPPPSI
ncbi:hypothetical protein CLOM_g18272 [Closterium sp. NIES-68]|nr:hypothetical protein CLOM_g18272 [Closterium sp. NIES-68]GJP63429.1 hypothetical protein CLOP_g20511 [Closterium sp. NIES-67]